jgi:tetratricopeptide (TPR) repeat protein
VGASAVVLAALSVCAVLSTSQLLEARKQRDEARLQTKRAEAQERFANMVMEQFGPGGRPLTREEMIDRSVQILDQQYVNDPRFVAQALIPISDRYMELGNTDKELLALQRAEGIARRLKDPILLADVECNLVETELDKGSPDRAEQRMNEARTLLAHTPAIPAQQRITCLHADATLADARGERAAAVERIETALALQERSDPTDRSYRALLTHAQVLYLYAGRPKDAYAAVEKTLAVLSATDRDNGEALAGTIHNQSLALYQMGEIRTALEREREAIAITTGNDESRPLASPMAQVMAKLNARMNSAAEAEVWAKRAASDARTGGNVAAQILALATLAEANVRADHINQAEVAAESAAHLLGTDNDSRELAAVQRARALVALGRGDLPSAQTAVGALLDAIGYPDESRFRISQSADLQLILAARVALEGARPSDAVRLASAALTLARDVARDPHQSATVGEAQMLLARALAATGDVQNARSVIRGAASALSAGLAPDHPLAIEAATLASRL